MDRESFPPRVGRWIDRLWDKDTFAEIPYDWDGNPLALSDKALISPLDWLRQRGLEDETIEKYHFGYAPGEDGYYGNSIVIPILDGYGRYRALRYRRLSGTPKYDQPKGERPHLFNISSARHPLVYVTEGEFDATILEQTGRHSVGVPGINNFREEWRWLFVGNHVRLVFDSESPGTQAWKDVRQATGRIVRQIEPLADSILVVELPEGHDVSSLYVEDPKALTEVLARHED